MKKLLLITLLLSGCVGMFAQTGIGTDNPNSNAILDLSSNTKGLLPPRLALTNTTATSPLSAHVAGMVVYNTATSGVAPTNVVPGLYINDGTSWKQLNTSVQKSSSYYGTVHAGDIGAGAGSSPCTGFILSAIKTNPNSYGDHFLITHNLNLTGNQSIQFSVYNNGGFSHYIFPTVRNLTANSFEFYWEESTSLLNDLTIMFTLTTY